MINVLPEPFLAFARRQSAPEIANQYEVLRRFALRRRALVTLAFGMGLAWQPCLVTLGFYLADMVFDALTLILLRDLDPAEEPGRYLAALVTNTALSVAFTTFPALSWLVDEPLAKAYALGLVLVALIHHSTLRNVHLPLSASASAGATAVAVAFNAALWIGQDNWQELITTSLCLVAMSYYATLTISAMHRLHTDLLFEREAARKANFAKTRFVVQLSHELRTPLNAIIGLSEAERLTAPDPQTRARMRVLVQSARDLGDLLEDILDLSAIEAEALSIRPTALELRSHVCSVAQLYRSQVQDNGMQMEVDLAPDLPARVWLDGRRLRQCLTNMLSNAVKYGRRGHEPSTIRLAVSESEGRLRFSVSDGGPGVDASLRDRIFEPFVRGHSDERGAGLGLAISRTLARRMGGDLVLEPAATGACFVLTLPCEVPPPGAVPPEAARLEGLRVLVVDDIATNRLVATTYLRLLGAVAIEAASGAEALRIARDARPDVILMDLMMPGLDGVETLARLQAAMGADLPPVIALSAESASDLPMAQGFAGSLAKPLTPEALRGALAEALAGV